MREEEVSRKSAKRRFAYCVEGARSVTSWGVVCVHACLLDLSLENVLIFRCPKTDRILPCLTDPGQAVVVDKKAASQSLASQPRPLEPPTLGALPDSDADSKEALPSLLADAAAADAERRVLLPPDKLFGKTFRPPEVYTREP